MGTVYRLLAVACLCFAGCTAANVPNTENTGTGAGGAPQTSLIRYSAADIAALPDGKFLSLDLTAPDTVYSVTYSDPADLDRVLVVRSDEQYVLGVRAPTTAMAQTNTLKQIVVSGNAVVDSQSGESVEGPSGDAIRHCTCPCCLQVGSELVCCD